MYGKRHKLVSVIVMTVVLTSIPLLNAYSKRLFYNSLDSPEAVEEGGGTIFPIEKKDKRDLFEDAQIEKGFFASEAGQAISFPTEHKGQPHIKAEAGTIAFWVDVRHPVGEWGGDGGVAQCWIFYSRNINKTDAWAIAHSHPNERYGITYLIKQERFDHFVLAQVDKRAWRKGLHHIAATWGPKGMQLYLDGELSGIAFPDEFKEGPKQLDNDFWIGNRDIDLDPAGNVTLFARWVMDEFYIFDTQLEQEQVKRVMDSPGPQAVDPADVLSVTWGLLKSEVLE